MAAKKKAAKKKAATKKAAPAKPAAPAADEDEDFGEDDAPRAKPAKGGKKPPLEPKSMLAALLGRATPAPVDDEAEPSKGPDREVSLPPMPKLPPRAKDGTITLAIGTGTVQAFMLQGLLTGKVETEDRSYGVERLEFDALDAVAQAGSRDVVLLPYAAYPRLRSRYLLMSCGSCFGDQRGPLLATRRPIRWSEVEEEGLRVAVPGAEHTGNLLLRLWLPKARLELMAMTPRQVVLMVRANQIRAGLLVDEEQITYREYNLVGVQDLGQWWGERTEGLPVPLTALGIRRDIPTELRDKIQLDLKRSIAYALGHREDTLEEIATHAPKHTLESVDAYVRRYVNDLSLDCGERGRQAASLLYEECLGRGALREPVDPVFHGDKVQ